MARVFLLAGAVAAAGAQAPDAMRTAMQNSSAIQAKAVSAMKAAADEQRSATSAAAALARQRQRDAVEPQKLSVSHFTQAPPPGLPPLVAAAPPSSCDFVSREQFDSYIKEAASKEGITPDLLRAVIAQESGFRPCAVSPKGAMGLMQLMPGTAQMLGVRNAFDPKQNIDAGTKFLKQLIDRYGGNLALALGAYNAGPARVDPGGELPLIEETLQYVNGILGKYYPPDR